MTISIYEIIQANQIFAKILQYEFTGKQSFIISRLLKALNNEIDSFNVAREKILKKYASKDEKNQIIFEHNGNIQIKEEEKNNFQKEFNELLYTNIKINADPIPLEWLYEIKLTPQEIIILEPFLII